MLQETNFTDIRRNYILSSITLILFLIYGLKIQIKQVLLFDLSGNWAIISPFWDLFILLFLFFLYTLFRYVIYGIAYIKDNKYTYLVLYDILDNLIIKSGQILDKNKYIKYGKITNLQENTKNLDGTIKSIQVNLDKDGHRSIFLHISHRNFQFDNGTVKEQQDTGSNVTFGKISKLEIFNDRIEFEYIESSISGIQKVELGINSKNIKKEFGSKGLSIIFKKEYSDIIWPLGLSLIIYCIFVFKITYFLFK